jgi:hypothetical protein
MLMVLATVKRPGSAERSPNLSKRPGKSTDSRHRLYTEMLLYLLTPSRLPSVHRRETYAATGVTGPRCSWLRCFQRRRPIFIIAKAPRVPDKTI